MKLVRLIDALRDTPVVDPDALARTKKAIRDEGRDGAAPGLSAWLTRPGPVILSPAQAVLGALLAAAAGGVVVELARPSTSDVASGTAPAAPTTTPQQVRFVFVDPSAASVSVAGDFNDWDLSTTPLQRIGPDGLWSVVVPLEAGRYTYSFVVDGSSWRPDPAAPLAAAEDFGRPSSVLLVSSRQ